ncbi:MAG: serine acetyltransferase [Phycisphaerae bacterium]|nr:serine acetyltransferase [Phycisphaerae bacterium]
MSELHIEKIVNKYSLDMRDSYLAFDKIQHFSCDSMPDPEKIYAIIGMLFEVLYPGYFCDVKKDQLESFITDRLSRISLGLYGKIFQYLKCDSDIDPEKLKVRALEITDEFIGSLPGLREKLLLDAMAAFKGDPAAEGTAEIIYSYPGTIAIGTYRLANILWKLGVPLLPRIMTEWAHSKTGVDCHPGATINAGFFIDHCTGVVIGETAIVGDNCKLYQGVTLGAVSFPHDEKGNIIRGQKRHPTLEDEVVVYSNASILGNVTIGKGTTVGGGVFLTRSVPPGSIVSNKPAELHYRNGCDPLKRGYISDFQV